jgi:hypothetical protein
MVYTRIFALAPLKEQRTNATSYGEVRAEPCRSEMIPENSQTCNGREFSMVPQICFAEKRRTRRPERCQFQGTDRSKCSKATDASAEKPKRLDRRIS